MKMNEKYIKHIIAIVITLSWIAYAFIISFGVPSVMAKEVFTTFTPIIMLVLGFYFGTTFNSSKKDETINNLTSKSE